MRWARTLVVGCAAALLMVGCLGASDDASDVVATRVPIALAGCTYIEFVTYVPTERAASFLPEAFRARDEPSSLTMVLLGGADCANAVSGNATGPSAFGWTSIVIDPPEDAVLQGEDVETYLYRVEHFVVDGAYRGAADAVGAERIQLASLRATVSPTAATLDLTNATFEHHVTGVATVPSGVEGADAVRWREFGTVDAGYAILEATLVPGASAGLRPGTASTGPGTAARSLLGESAMGLVSFGSAYEVRDGWMGVVALPADARATTLHATPKH